MIAPRLSTLSFCLVLGTACGSSHGTGTADASTTTDAMILRNDVTTLPDATSFPDVGQPEGTCAAQNATVDVCFAVNEEAEADRVPFGAFFDGSRCVSHDWLCRGPDCFRYSGGTREDAVGACERANAHCMQIKCSTTGGLVRAGCATRCGYDTARCVTTVCDCGPGRTFNGQACATDASCNDSDFCLATRGTPNLAGCAARPALPPLDGGTAADCRPVTPCECPIGRLFVPGRGCIATNQSDPCTGTECRCANTGGAWNPSACGADRCGRPSGLDCTSGGCECQPSQTWDTTYGCVDNFECRSSTRPQGVRCETDSDCHPGLGCCSGPRFQPVGLPRLRVCTPQLCAANGTTATCPAT